jgi:hypothetical protein
MKNKSILGCSAAVVDGTEIRIPRPSQPTEERSTYSVKKRQHSFTLILFACLMDVLFLVQIH